MVEISDADYRAMIGIIMKQQQDLTYLKAELEKYQGGRTEVGSEAKKDDTEASPYTDPNVEAVPRAEPINDKDSGEAAPAPKKADAYGFLTITPNYVSLYNKIKDMSKDEKEIAATSFRISLMENWKDAGLGDYTLQVFDDILSYALRKMVYDGQKPDFTVKELVVAANEAEEKRDVKRKLRYLLQRESERQEAEAPRRIEGTEEEEAREEYEEEKPERKLEPCGVFRTKAYKIDALKRANEESDFFDNVEVKEVREWGNLGKWYLGSRERLVEVRGKKEDIDYLRSIIDEADYEPEVVESGKTIERMDVDMELYEDVLKKFNKPLLKNTKVDKYKDKVSGDTTYHIYGDPEDIEKIREVIDDFDVHDYTDFKVEKVEKKVEKKPRKKVPKRIELPKRRKRTLKKVKKEDDFHMGELFDKVKMEDEPSDEYDTFDDEDFDMGGEEFHKEESAKIYKPGGEPGKIVDLTYEEIPADEGVTFMRYSGGELSEEMQDELEKVEGVTPQVDGAHVPEDKVPEVEGLYNEFLKKELDKTMEKINDEPEAKEDEHYEPLPKDMDEIEPADEENGAISKKEEAKEETTVKEPYEEDEFYRNNPNLHDKIKSQKDLEYYKELFGITEEFEEE
ncbi:MAG: hypothetical protein ACE5J7_00110 [Candidatus Aenigmatarchaeota archaeon]